MYATTFIWDVRDNVSCWHHAGWDQSSKFHHGKWKFDEVIWRQEHILDGRRLCKQKGNWHCFAVLTWNSEPAEVLLQHVLSKLYQNNPGITGVTCSIPTNILTLQTTLTKSLGFKYSSSPTDTRQGGGGSWNWVSSPKRNFCLRDHGVSFRFVAICCFNRCFKGSSRTPPPLLPSSRRVITLP